MFVFTPHFLHFNWIFRLRKNWRRHFHTSNVSFYQKKSCKHEKKVFLAHLPEVQLAPNVTRLLLLIFLNLYQLYLQPVNIENIHNLKSEISIFEIRCEKFQRKIYNLMCIHKIRLRVRVNWKRARENFAMKWRKMKYHNHIENYFVDFRWNLLSFTEKLTIKYLPFFKLYFKIGTFKND